MRVLHIVGGDLNGGAARGAYWLHLALKELGIDSKIFTNSKITLGDNTVITSSKTKKDKALNLIRGQIDTLLTNFYPKRKRIIFSSGLIGINFTKIQEYKEADIIHLHWINNGFINFKHLATIDKPIVWTMRDMWPITGGCHVAEALGCAQYKTGCGKCKQLKSNSSFDLSKIIVNRKKKYIPNSIKVVGISNWLSECAKESLIFRDFDIRTIHNNIDTNEFFSIEKAIARSILALPQDKKIILAGAQSMNVFYKGFDKLLTAYENLPKDHFLLFFGNVDNKLIDELGFQYKSLGFLSDIVSMRLAYSSADVFVAPSVMEAFGKTVAESMACGTPVVCFNATGHKDIVTHKEDGYKAEPFDSNDLANGIEWVLEDEERYQQLCFAAREKVVEKFDSAKVARQYIELYQSLLQNRDLGL